MLKKRAESGASGRLPGTDPLTGLPGRAELRGWLDERLVHSRATSEGKCLFLVDAANLGEVNDTFGPDVGDEVVAEVAQRLARFVGSAGAVARYNGAEFAAVVDGLGMSEKAREVGEEMLNALGAPFLGDTLGIPLSSHIGAALAGNSHEDSQSWMLDAHDALVQARNDGVGSIVVHDESSRNRVGPLITDNRVRQAYENEEFVVVYQPIVTPSTSTIVGFEALLRWLDPSSGVGLIAPGQFLPLLEKSGLITEVGAWALRQAVTRVGDWNEQRAGHDPFFVSVNLGAKQIAQTSFAESVTQALDAVSFKPELLSLDVTPAAIKYNKKATWGALRELKYLGVRIALDDFGVGDSSMGYLRELQIDLLRIDRMFVEGLGQIPEDTAIVRHLVGLGRDLGILTLAEGVETPEQHEQLQELSCPLAQGWHYGRPELPSEIEAKLF